MVSGYSEIFLFTFLPFFFLFFFYELIDLFSLYILFSHFRPRDATRGNSFFQLSSYARANLRITNEKKQKENSHEGITWSEMGKQNVQAEEVYYQQIVTYNLSDYKHFVIGQAKSDSPNRTAEQPIKIKHFMPLKPMNSTISQSKSRKIFYVSRSTGAD